MKTYNLLKFLLFLILLSSCESKDPPNVDTFEEDVINLWQLEMKGVSDEENFVLTDCGRQSTIEFFEDNTFQRITYAVNDDGVCEEIENISGTWEVDFKKGLGLTVNGETDFMSASVGIIDQETNTFSKKSNGNILRLFNTTEVNVIEEIFNKINE